MKLGRRKRLKELEGDPFAPSAVETPSKRYLNRNGLWTNGYWGSPDHLEELRSQGLWAIAPKAGDAYAQENATLLRPETLGTSKRLAREPETE